MRIDRMRNSIRHLKQNKIYPHIYSNLILSKKLPMLTCYHVNVTNVNLGFNRIDRRGNYLCLGFSHHFCARCRSSSIPTSLPGCSNQVHSLFVARHFRDQNVPHTRTGCFYWQSGCTNSDLDKRKDTGL